MQIEKILRPLLFVFFITVSFSSWGEAVKIPPSVLVKPAPDGKHLVTFFYKPDSKVETLALAGTFNHWDKSAAPMSGPDKDGRYSATLTLPDGAHLYKFVINGETWVADPLNPRKVDDDYGGFNSVLLLGDVTPSDVWMPHPELPSVAPDFQTPLWARDVVWYQIFPDRFRNGSKKNDPDHPVVPWRAEWFKLQPWEKGDFYRPLVFLRIYGGDLQGVREKFGYLRELGISAIYFNPLFEAPSLHKYDATTYLHVDDNFAFKGDQVGLKEDFTDPKTWRWTKSDKYFLKLIKMAHRRGIHVIIDGVFNHVGEKNLAFLDVKNNRNRSKYFDWFDVVSWEPFKYKGWQDYGGMPAIAQGPDGFPPSYEKYIFNVTRRWMDPNGDSDPSDGVDGWRLDVAAEIKMEFWKKWRRLVKSINPDAYLTGEIWGNPGQWLRGDAFDGTMNYDFARIAQHFFFDKKNKISASEFDRQLAALRDSLPPQAAYVTQNLYDSHDIDRLASQIKNPDRPYDAQNRSQDESGKNYDETRPSSHDYRIMKLMVVFQMTYVGAPMIYYGNEVGMFGADDPSNRKPMLWKDLEPYENPNVNSVDEDMLSHYRHCIAIRNTYPALRTGGFRIALADDAADVYAYWRTKPGANAEHILVVMNNSEQKQTVSVSAPNLKACTPFIDVLNSPVKYYYERSPFKRGKWRCIKCPIKSAKTCEVKNGKIKVILEPKWAAVLVQTEN